MTEREQRYYETPIALPAEIGERLLKPPTLEEELQQLNPEVQNYIAGIIAERDMYRREARTDLLTELPNRLGLHEWIDPLIENLMYEREGKGRREDSSKSLVLAVIDIDHFKSVNDSVGHKIGDEVLKWLSGEMRAQIRNEDMVARYGGEEFVIGFYGADTGIAMDRLEALRQHVETASKDKLGEWGIKDRPALTISLGLAEFDGACESYNDVFLRADAAVYAAKHDRNQALAYNPNDPDMAAKLREP